MTRKPDHLSTRDADVKIKSFTDGTTTVVKIVKDSPWGEIVIGEGSARRRAGDRRNESIGLGLASARAFTNAATAEYERVHDVL